MVPAMMEQLLFDDILHGDRAREEHGQFRRVMQLFGVEVLEAADLLEECLGDERARRWVVDVVLRDLAPAARRSLADRTPAELAHTLVAGSAPRRDPRGVEVEDLYDVPPLPNWCFQRDPQVVVGDGVIFSSMAEPARHREALLARVLFSFHPDYHDVPVWFDPLAAGEPTLPLEATRPLLEGGDVLVVSPDVLVVGISARTNPAAVKHLARALTRRDGGPRWLVVADIPKRRAYMHLDTVFTPLDRDACLVYPPVIHEGGSEPISVYEIDLHTEDLSFAERPSLLGALAARGVDLEPIQCGGGDPVAQQREQWTDGANAFALAPGVILLYARNLRTAEALADHGYRVLKAEDLLLGREEVDPEGGERLCIQLPSTEISRARGGPHCLTHPLERDPL